MNQLKAFGLFVALPILFFALLGMFKGCGL